MGFSEIFLSPILKNVFLKEFTIKESIISSKLVLIQFEQQKDFLNLFWTRIQKKKIFLKYVFSIVSVRKKAICCVCFILDLLEGKDFFLIRSRLFSIKDGKIYIIGLCSNCPG